MQGKISGMNKTEILQWLQEVQHPAKEDQNMQHLEALENETIAETTAEKQ